MNIRLTLIILILLLIYKNINAQSSIDEKYLRAIIYLQTNEKLDKFIGEVYNGYKKGTKKKDPYIKFNVSGWHNYLSLRYYNESLKNSNHGIDRRFIDNWNLYDSIYKFESFKHPLLGNLIEQNDSPFILVFSKPVDNYLMANILLNFKDSSYEKRPPKIGKFIELVFFFDEQNQIKDYFIGGGHYH